MTPAIFGMNVFVTIDYGYQPLPVVIKSSILNVSRVLDLPLKCNDLINSNESIKESLITY